MTKRVLHLKNSKIIGLISQLQQTPRTVRDGDQMANKSLPLMADLLEIPIVSKVAMMGKNGVQTSSGSFST